MSCKHGQISSPWPFIKNMADHFLRNPIKSLCAKRQIIQFIRLGLVGFCSQGIRLQKRSLSPAQVKWPSDLIFIFDTSNRHNVSTYQIWYKCVHKQESCKNHAWKIDLWHPIDQPEWGRRSAIIFSKLKCLSNGTGLVRIDLVVSEIWRFVEFQKTSYPPCPVEPRGL